MTAFAQSIDTLPKDIRETRPAFHSVACRASSRRSTRASSRPRQQRGFARGSAIFDWAIAVGREREPRTCSEARPLPLLALAAVAGGRPAGVLASIQQSLGGRINSCCRAARRSRARSRSSSTRSGVLILEGYGLTETTPILTGNRPDAYKFGTVGPALHGVTLKIAEDGEILAKGPNIAQGYYKRPEATAEAWDAEGWFHTGDIGEIDADGFLRITDRKKDLIKTSGGKYVAPQNIENLLKTQPHISQAVVIGDNRKYCVALITLDRDEIRRSPRREGIEIERPRRARQRIRRSMELVELRGPGREPAPGVLREHQVLPHRAPRFHPGDG